MKDMEKDISGVYLIQCKINGKGYIGSSKCIKSRWTQHLGMLRRGNHNSFVLQEDFNKYGESEFLFKVLRTCSVSDSRKYEQEYIEIFNTVKFGYNARELKEITQDRWSSFIDKLYYYMKECGYKQDGNMYFFNLFDVSSKLNVTPTYILKQFGVNKFKRWNIVHCLDDCDNYVSIEFDTYDGLQLVAYHKSFFNSKQYREIKCFNSAND